MSRIHLSIRYKRPDDEQRKDIWNALFDKLERDQAKERRSKQDKVEPSDISCEDQTEKLSKPSIKIANCAKQLALGEVDPACNKLGLNGRDIRNCQSCMTLT
jgi:hypothetical protein